MNNIEKPWCIMKGVIFFPQDIGKIEELSSDGKTARVRYSEGQLYSLEPWDTRYLTRFETLDECTREFMRLAGEPKMEEFAAIKFPSEFKKVQHV